MIQRLQYMCAGDCAFGETTERKFQQHSPHLCEALGRGDKTEVARLLRSTPQYRLDLYTHAKSFIA